MSGDDSEPAPELASSSTLTTDATLDEEALPEHEGSAALQNIVAEREKEQWLEIRAHSEDADTADRRSTEESSGDSEESAEADPADEKHEKIPISVVSDGEAPPALVKESPEEQTLESSGAEAGKEIIETTPPSGAQQAESLSPAGAGTVRTRSESRSTTTSRNTPVSSSFFVVTALESIGASKEARKSKDFEAAVQKALENIKSNDQPVDPELIFQPLQLATKTFSIPLQVTALDCIGKLISYSYFAFPTTTAADPDSPPLIERAIETICDCFENEATPIEIQQQIVKSLLAAILDDKIVVHGAGLLKAVRQIYNIFIYSKSSQNQQVAQGSLTQMVATVFERVRVRLDLKQIRMRGNLATKSEEDLPQDPSVLEQEELNGDATPSLMEGDEVQSHGETGSNQGQVKLTLQSFETSKNLDDAVVADNAPTTVTRARKAQPALQSSPGQNSTTNLGDEHDDGELSSDDEEDEIYIKDAFLVFRSLCKLSQKSLSHEQQQDLKSQNMRSKLLSLYLIHHLLNNYIDVFTSPLSSIKSGSNGESTAFMQVAKSHLCLSLSRNASSSVPRVYQVSCQIFWLSLKHMRVSLKKELEVFLKEVYLAVLEKRNAPLFQKQMFMDVLEELSTDPRALVEIYLNYDCDRTALDNMYQAIVGHLAKICSAPVTVTSQQQQQFQETHGKPATPTSDWHSKGSLLPGLSTASISHTIPPTQSIPIEYILKQQSLRCLVNILDSLNSWSTQLTKDSSVYATQVSTKVSMEASRESLDNPLPPSSPRIPSGSYDTGSTTPIAEDDPSEIEKVRKRKTALNDAIRKFNFKPKHGIKALISDGFIKSGSPQDIARFLLSNDRLNKTALGEYLGEGDEENIATMHAFVDLMEFAKRRFVDALRQFLQSFRLPGEAQKIDRFMLKFAERYLTGNPNAFANADTAYVLAYSVIMLNTDQHSSKMKGKRMTVEDFIKNNRGINDGQSLPTEYLTAIYEEIARNEIVLDSEREHAAEIGIQTAPAPSGLASRAGQALANVGRDLQKEKYAQASEEMANKTEQLYRSLIRAQKRSVVREQLSRFIPASSVKHVGPMFNVTWMSFLSGFSGQMQDAHNIDLIRQCLDGFRLAIKIACRFDLETPRTAFVTSLAKFTNLGNLKEMMAKNLEALRVLVDVALTEAHLLRESWREILTCISQLDRFQLLSGGVDEGVLPDVTRAHIPMPSNLNENGRPRKSVQAARRPRPKSTQSNISYRSDVATETKSADMIRDVDRIFTNTAHLSSEAIVEFVRALCEVSAQEIQSSGNSDSPRVYSLQKLVEISYYNMTRVRIEWTRIWEILGDHFNQIGCNANTAIAFFALDSLRQLSMRFMEIEELPGFKFQKDFLKPFEYVMTNSRVPSAKDMALRCLIQMIQARGDNIRSGWKTMFGVFTAAAKEQHETIVNMAFDYTSQVYNTWFGVVITQGAFPDLVVCLTEFSKNLKFQKKSLQAIETLKSTAPRLLRTPECPLSWRHHKPPNGEANGVHPGVRQPTSQSEEEQFWYPVLIAYQDVLMTGEDLEVRSRALTYLFETLIKYGGDFPVEFWDVLWRQLLYPIFVVLQSKSEMSKAPNHEELSVWLSTTMIQALRNMITLFTHYFESLEHMLDRFLDLLTLCICQENDTIARIGSNCLQQLILQNVAKFRPVHWAKIVGAFVELFNRTTAYELFSAAATMSDARPPTISDSTADGLSISTPPSEVSPASNGIETSSALGDSTLAPNIENVPFISSAEPSPATELEDYRPHPDLHAQTATVSLARRAFFNRIITNCVLQLLMIETVNELFSNDSVYEQIPSPELLRLMGLLKKSYQFAKKFNGDKELRMALWRQGFMKQPPNLLKQESGSAGTYVGILMRMYHDEGEERIASRVETERALIPLCADIIRSYTLLDDETQQRNIVAWRPVVVEVLQGYTEFPREGFDKHVEAFYALSVGLLEKELVSTSTSDMRGALWGFFRRVGEVRMGMQEWQAGRGEGSIAGTPGPTPTGTSPSVERTGFGWSRRSSKAGK